MNTYTKSYEKFNLKFTKCIWLFIHSTATVLEFTGLTWTLHAKFFIYNISKDCLQF